MFTSLARILSVRSNIVFLNAAVFPRGYSLNAVLSNKNQVDCQVDYIRSIDDKNAQSQDWTKVKNNVLSIRGNLNPKNVDAVMLRIMVASKNFVAASLFAKHLNKTGEELSLGSINSILQMYTELGKLNELNKEQKQFILDTHKSLYEKYKVLDSSTCEYLLHVLCVMNEWEKALKPLNDIHLSSVPTHSAYSTLIATCFKLNKKKKAIELIEESIKYKRPLQNLAYEEWINHILRKYKDKKIIAKHLEEILNHITKNWAVITEKTANRLKEVYTTLGWSVQLSRIRKTDGQCSSCSNKLQCLKLSDEEFNALQNIVKDKLIVGSDLLLKTTDKELERFLDFVERSAPYDIVLDGLNICYTLGKASHLEKLRLLDYVVEYFHNKNKKILLLSRRHMLRWNQKLMERIMQKTSGFFTENLSQDDPFFITAAILSGPHTDIMSKDLLRGHKFNLKDESLKQLFNRWQWQHQWRLYFNQKGVVVQPPLSFTPCAQGNGSTWHFPYEKEIPTLSPMFNDGTPDLTSWICLRQKL